jgi:hypothetical protein
MLKIYLSITYFMLKFLLVYYRDLIEVIDILASKFFLLIVYKNTLIYLSITYFILKLLLVYYKDLIKVIDILTGKFFTNSSKYTDSSILI